MLAPKTLLGGTSNALAEAIAELERVGKARGDLQGAWARLTAALELNDPALSAVPDDIFPRLAALPFSAREAIGQMAMNRVISERVLSGYYRDNLIVLATMEKSASTMHEIAFNEMLRHTANIPVIVPTPRQHIAGPVHMGGGASFSAAMLMFFPNGGTLRGAFEPSRQTMQLLGEIGSKIVVLMRHPADRIVAQYCMRASEFSGLSAFQSIFLDEALPFSVDPLIHNLRWIAGWKRRAMNRHQIVVARYEDMLADPATHFGNIHRFLFTREPSDELMSTILRLHTSIKESQGAALQSGDPSTRSYEQGWTGRAGVWRDYLNDADISAYNTVVRQFLASDPAGSCARQVYPDLILT